MLGALQQAFGPHTRYFAIDGGNWPPKASRVVQLRLVGDSEHDWGLNAIAACCRDSPWKIHRPSGASSWQLVLISRLAKAMPSRKWQHTSAASLAFRGAKTPGSAMATLCQSDVFERHSAGRMPFVIFSNQHPAVSAIQHFQLFATIQYRSCG
jgi:hypothetical protein